MPLLQLTSSPVLQRLGALAARLGRFGVRHPVAVAGTGLLGMEGLRRAREMEASLLAERWGLPGAKYGELEKFAERKEYLNVKVAFGGWHDPIFSNVPGDAPASAGVTPAGLGGDILSSAVRGVAGGVATAGLSAIGKMIRGAGRSIKERLFLNKEREDLVDNIMKNDPYVSVFEEEDPGATIKAYSTLVRVAPTLSLDPNITTAYLRNATQTGGALDFQTVKLLADAEHAIKRARGDIGDRQ